MGQWNGRGSFCLTSTEREQVFDVMKFHNIPLKRDWFINQVEMAMHDTAWDMYYESKGVIDKKNKKGQLEKFLKKTIEYHRMLRELEHFGRSVLTDPNGEIAAAISHARPEVMELQSILESKVIFHSSKNGRPPGHTNEVARHLRDWFCAGGIAVSKKEGSFYMSILRICLESLGLPWQEPYKAVRNMSIHGRVGKQ